MQTPCHCFLPAPHPPHTNTAVLSVPVSACRLLVVTRLTEGPSSSEVVRRMGAPPRRLAPRETTCCAGRCSDVRVVSRPVQRLRARGSQFSCHTPARALLYALPAGSGYTATPPRMHRGGKQPRGTGRQQVEMTDRRSIERGRPETRREEPAGHRWTGNGRTPRERIRRQIRRE